MEARFAAAIARIDLRRTEGEVPPERYDRFDLLASTIDHTGRLLALLVDPAQDGSSDLPWRRKGPWSPPIPRFDAVAVICDGDDVHEIPLHGLDQWFSEIDTLGEGVILGASRIPLADYGRAEQQSKPATEVALIRNVQAFDGDGNPLRAFYAGDGIEQLLTDPSGRIWISYFDEASYRFVNSDGMWSCSSMPGLARWDDPGSDPWFARNSTGTAVSWVDCYALNVGQSLVEQLSRPVDQNHLWAFPRLSGRGVRACRCRSCVRGAAAHVFDDRMSKTVRWLRGTGEGTINRKELSS